MTIFIESWWTPDGVHLEYVEQGKVYAVSSSGCWGWCQVSWMVVESKRLLLIDDAKSSVRICRHPFLESDQPVGI